MTVTAVIPVVAIITALEKFLFAIWQSILIRTKIFPDFIWRVIQNFLTDLFLLELDLLLNLPLPQHLGFEVVGHVGNRRVEERAQNVHKVLEWVN